MLDGMALALHEIADQLAWASHWSGKAGFRTDATLKDKLAKWCRERVELLHLEAEKERRAA